MSSDREQLLETLGHEVRAGQRATDIVDDLVCEIFGINRTDARALDLLEQRGQMTAGQLAQESGLSTGAITGVIDRLERSGYARRVPDPSDRRRVLVELTEKAMQLTWELMGEPMSIVGREMAAEYSDEQLELLLGWMRRGREIQEQHAEWLRERLAASKPKARGRPRLGSRTAP
jgi:DNA-binding MarR family transcriptional regulator